MSEPEKKPHFICFLTFKCLLTQEQPVTCRLGLTLHAFGTKRAALYIYFAIYVMLRLGKHLLS